MITLARTAHEHGVTPFDAAEAYGLVEVERILGEAPGGDGARTQIRVFTQILAHYQRKSLIERKSLIDSGGSEWGSNPPVTGLPAARRF
jgi:aryl-alcohol dehydrogenase-like predicted oxidoreductase